MKNVFAFVILALSMSACGNNSVSTKNDVEEAFRANTPAPLPVVEETEFNANLEAVIRTNTFLKHRKSGKIEGVGGTLVEICSFSSELYHQGKPPYKNAHSSTTHGSEGDCLRATESKNESDAAEIAAFLKKYSAGFKLKVLVGRMFKILPETYYIDPAVVTALTNGFDVPAVKR